MQLGTIFTIEQYDEAYQYVTDNNYSIQEVESKEGERQFKIVELPQPSEEEIKQQRIEELKGLLVETDYVVIKIMEGEATEEEYAEVLANRKLWRKEINELQQ